MWRGIEGKPYTLAQFQRYVAGLHFETFPFKPQFCVLHNTGIPRFAPWVNSAGKRQPGWHDVPGERRMKGLESFYRDTQKWSAGPHLFIADDFIWTFTPLWLQGTHAPSWNRVAWGVEMVGDYDKEPLSPGVYLNSMGALAALHRLGHLNPATLKFHKEDPKTTHYGCPGKAVQKPAVLAMLQHLLIGTADFSDVTGGSSSTAAA